MENTSEYKRWRKPGVPTTRFLLDFYDACLRESSLQKAAIALGASKKEAYAWVKESEALKEAHELAESRRGGPSTLQGYIYGTLSEEALEVWNELKFWKDKDSTYERMEKLFSGKTVQLRKELFVHALVSSNYDMSNACKMVGVSRGLMRSWMESDVAFRTLVDEIQWHKKNFFEKKLLQLVEEGHPGAIMFTARTINSDRGYTEKIKVEGMEGNNGPLIDLEELKLDLDTRRKILEAIRQQKLEKAAAAARPVEGNVIPQLQEINDV